MNMVCGEIYALSQKNIHRENKSTTSMNIPKFLTTLVQA